MPAFTIVFRQVVVALLMKYWRVHCAKGRFNLATQDLLVGLLRTAAAPLTLRVPCKVLRKLLGFRRFGKFPDCRRPPLTAASCAWPCS